MGVIATLLETDNGRRRRRDQRCNPIYLWESLLLENYEDRFDRIEQKLELQSHLSMGVIATLFRIKAHRCEVHCTHVAIPFIYGSHCYVAVKRGLFAVMGALMLQSHLSMGVIATQNKCKSVNDELFTGFVAIPFIYGSHCYLADGRMRVKVLVIEL